LNGKNPSKSLIAAAVSLTWILAASCLLLPRGFDRVAISDVVSGFLMLTALFAFSANGLASKGRLRWFWMLQVAGWALWFCDQVVWLTFDLILKQKLPGMSPADALLFLGGFHDGRNSSSTASSTFGT
jgi:hypothetical protein